MSELNKAIEFAQSGEARGFKEVIDTHLTQLANKAIDEIKLDIAKQIGKSEEVEEVETEEPENKENGE